MWEIGHWYMDQEQDGSLRTSVTSLEPSPTSGYNHHDRPIKNYRRDKNPNNDRKHRSTVFNTPRLSTNTKGFTVQSHTSSAPSLGPMIDNGAPYSAIDKVEWRAI